MMNFRDGVFAFGVFFGFVFAVVSDPLTKFLGVNSDFIKSEAFIGILIGSACTLFASFYVYWRQHNGEIVDAVTAAQIRLVRNLVVINSIDGSWKRTAIKQEHVSSSEPPRMAQYIDSRGGRKVTDVSEANATLIIALLEADDKGKFVEFASKMFEVENLHELALGARSEAYRRAGLPENISLQVGRLAMDEDKFATFRSDLEKAQHLAELASQKSKEVIEEAPEIFRAIQAGLLRKTGQKPGFVDLG